MIQQLRQKLHDSPATRWGVLILVSLTMLAGYIISDVMAPLKTMLEQQLGWSSGDYGLFTSGYGWINIFLLMLIIGGMILDRKGPRFTGLLAVGLMIGGTAMKYWAVSTDFAGAQILGINAQVLWAALGYAIAAAGIEMIGITANKIVVKWFTGRSLALALGLNVGAGRIGTALAMFGAIPVAKHFGSVSAPLLLCLMALVIGLLSFLVFIMIDRKADAQDGGKTTAAEQAEEEQFRLSDILRIASIRGWWYITILCVLFYSAVFPFLKYATDLMIQKFHVSSSLAGLIPGLLPFGNILLTPLFGSIYDRRGRGATIMIIGAVLLVAVHLVFSIPQLTMPWLAVTLVVLLGAAFSLVPSAMWPSVPKIVPYRMLGTAYSMIFWIQNWGLTFVPLLIGWVLDNYCVTGRIVVDGVPVTAYDYTLPMLLFALFGAASVIFGMLLRREDNRKGYGLEKPNIA